MVRFKTIPWMFEKNLYFLFKGYKDMYVYVNFCIYSYLYYSKLLFLLIFIQSVIGWQWYNVSKLIISVVFSVYILVFDDYVFYHISYISVTSSLHCIPFICTKYCLIFPGFCYLPWTLLFLLLFVTLSHKQFFNF